MLRYIDEIKNRIFDFFQHFVLFLKNILLFFKAELREIILFTLLCMIISIASLQLLNDVISFLYTSLTGFKFVNLGNIAEVARSPVTYLSLLLYLIPSTFLAIFEISGLLHAYSMSQVGRDTTLLNMVMAGYRVCKKTLNPKNWLIIPFLIVLFPLTGVLTLSSAGYKAAIPYFILQWIESNRVTNRLYIAFYILLLVIELIYIFSINIYVLQDVSFPKALKRSRKLGKGFVLNTLASMILLVLLNNFMINSVSSALTINVEEFVSLFRKDSNVFLKSLMVGNYVYVLRQILRTIIAPAINCAALTVLFYRYIEEKEQFNLVAKSTFHAEPANQKLAKEILLGIGIWLLVYSVYDIKKHLYLLEPVDHYPEVCAHRGDNVHAPENTYPAFELAIMENTPWVETDVIQTADGVVVCSHDHNLSRVTGHNVTISTSTFGEIQNYEMGSWMPGSYDTGIKVPSLESVMQLVAENNTKIQIELKPTENDINLEEEVIRLIHKYKLEDRSMVISLHGDSIERIKELDPSIKTALCVNAAWEGFKDVSYSDNLSISDNSVTPDLVKKMHDAGIKVFCWTVDDMDDVQYLVSCGVDVIGTNDPLSIELAVEAADTQGGINRVFQIMMHTITSMER